MKTNPSSSLLLSFKLLCYCYLVLVVGRLCIQDSVAIVADAFPTVVVPHPQQQLNLPFVTGFQQPQQQRQRQQQDTVIGRFHFSQNAAVDDGLDRIHPSFVNIVRLRARTTPNDGEGRGDENEDGADIDDGNTSDNDSTNSNDMSSFLESFRQAANSKLGKPLTEALLMDGNDNNSDFVQSSSQQAQNDFLRAMQEAKQSMDEAKQQTGGDVDKAIDIVMKDIQQQEDFLQGLEQTMMKSSSSSESGDGNSGSSSSSNNNNSDGHGNNKEFDNDNKNDDKTSFQ